MKLTFEQQIWTLSKDRAKTILTKCDLPLKPYHIQYIGDLLVQWYADMRKLERELKDAKR
jgi:hypothetical protein